MGVRDAHWLRNTFLSHAVTYAGRLKSVRNFAGHESLDTTSVYATTEIAWLYREAEAFLLRATRSRLASNVRQRKFHALAKRF